MFADCTVSLRTLLWILKWVFKIQNGGSSQAPRILKPFMNNKPFEWSYVYEIFFAALETTQKHVRGINFSILNPSFAEKRTDGLRKMEISS